MKFATIALASILALSGSFALGHSYKRTHHTMRHSMNMMHGSAKSGNPNGTAGGPTTLSGTGSSKFGGQTPGTSGKQ